ncbi:hypothetical protein BP6252_00304 [Coleophoma cylindrospora]|uniref:Uncharacterized protein n=1 Tax=Coleophoma cylindrospora TaxID=1849047 RepID=A0A3D8SPQ4_9HELO|nr:hypothetical protein BP6252_00304 [Coleophoma cylindrospora]
MASENFGAELLKLAAHGDTLTAALTKHAAAVNKETSISPLSTTITLVTSVLRCLAEDIAKHNTDHPVKAQIMTFLIGLCRENFDHVQFALDRVLGNVCIISQKLDLGGRYLRASMDETKARLWCTLDAARYLALRKAEQEQVQLNTLDANQTLELTRLVDQVPYIYRGLESLEAEVKRTTGFDLNTGSKKELIREIQVEPVVERGKIVRHFVDDDDVLSIRSTSSSLTDDQVIDMDEFYEAWVIRKDDGDTRRSRRSWRFLGLSVTEHVDEQSFWEVLPQLKSQEELKEQIEDLSADMLKSGHPDDVNDIVANLPDRVQEEIKYLLEDRERATTNGQRKHYWQVVDVEEMKPKQKSPAKSWLSKRKDSESSEWTIIIKGQTSDDKKKHRPHRFHDPWRKSGAQQIRVDCPRVIPEFSERPPVVCGMSRSRYNEFPKKPSMGIHEMDVKIKNVLVGV